METSASSSLDKLQTYHCPRNKQKQTTDNREKKKKTRKHFRIFKWCKIIIWCYQEENIAP